MARVEAASASVNSDSIKGLAQSIAKPAYRRLLTAEPALRRAVPALIIAFLVTICIGAFVQVIDHRRHAIGEIVRSMTASAEFFADRLGRSSVTDDRRKQSELEHSIPAWALAPGRQIMLTNADGGIVAALRIVLITHDGVTAAGDTARHGRRRPSAWSIFSGNRSHWILWGPRPACWRSPWATARRPMRRCIGSPRAWAR